MDKEDLLQDVWRSDAYRKSQCGTSGPMPLELLRWMAGFWSCGFSVSVSCVALRFVFVVRDGGGVVEVEVDCGYTNTCVHEKTLLGTVPGPDVENARLPAKKRYYGKT